MTRRRRALRALGAAELTPVLEPPLDGFEPAVAELLRSRLERVERLIAEEGSEGELASELGELGRLFLVYDLPEAAESCLVNAARLEPDEFSWHYLVGAIRQERGDLADAQAALAAARELSPDDPALLLRLARIEFELGREEAAEELYRALLEVEGFGAAAGYGLGRIAAARGDLPAAVERFEAALADQPEASQIRYQLGLAYRGLGDRDRARQYLESRGAARLGFPDPEMERLAEGARGAELYLANGRRLRNRGDLPGAVAAFQQAVLEEPDDPGPWGVLGATLLEMGRVEDSVRAYREVLRLDPDDPGMLYNLALGLIELGGLEEAERHLETLVRAAPDHVDARVNLATLYERAGRPAEAERLLATAIELDPYDRSLRTHRASVLTALGRALEARRELGDLLREDPRDAEALIALGLANEALGSPGDAAAAWERVLELPAPPETRARALFFGGRSMLRQGRAREAVERLERAVEILPANRELRTTLAGALGAAGDFRRAVEQYDLVIDSAPGDAGARFGKAMSLLLSERERDARAHLEASLEIVPESLPLEHLLARVLATASEPGVRDGARSLELARRVFERAQTFDHAETVAMAFAELGEFDAAAGWQEQIVSRARAAGEAGRAARLEARKRQYERGEPVRAPWRGEPSPPAGR